MDTLIAEDLLLLLLDDDSGKLTGTTFLDTGIGGAILVELALAGCVEVIKGSGLWARAKVVATVSDPPADPLLNEALELVSAKERTAQDLVTRLGKKRRDLLLNRLRERGILEESEDRVLGLIPRRRWPMVDSTHEDDVRRQLGDVLIRGASPQPHTAALIAVLSALDLTHKVVDREGLTARQVKTRAKEVAEGDWAAKAVRDSIAAAQAAVMAAVVASTAAAGS
ncbi:MAG: GPP34 family phosphoprotein [Marmoricola sp.]